jgi:hypothetical protein
MTHKLIPLDSKNEWNEALKGIDHSFGHTWGYCYSMYLTTGYDTYLYCFEKDGVRKVCPIIERNFSGYTDIAKPFGISGFTGNGVHPDFHSEWRNFVSEKKYISGYLGLFPIYNSVGLFPETDLFNYTSLYLLDLKPPMEVILKNMSRNRRRQYRQWKKVSNELVTDNKPIETFFHNHYEDFLIQKKASKAYYLSSETISQLLESDDVFAVGVEKSGKIVAATIFAFTKHVGDALLHCSLPDERDHSALMIWHAISRFKENGISVMNFGGANSKSLAEFKKRFGAISKPMISIKQIYRKDIYDSLCKEANIDPNDDEGFFPAYRKNC